MKPPADTNVANASRGLREGEAAAKIALAALSPIELLMEPLYNPTGGYASYVVPAALVLIIQQTLLIGAATLIGLGFERRGPVSRLVPIGPASLLGRGLAHLTIYIASLVLFLVILPRIYGFSTLGRLADLALFAVPFVLATSFMDQAARCFFKHREIASWSLSRRRCRNFLVGVSWPREMIPPLLDHNRRVFPSESGDRRPRAHQSVGRHARRGASGLALSLVARSDLFRPRGSGGAPAEGEGGGRSSATSPRIQSRLFRIAIEIALSRTGLLRAIRVAVPCLRKFS